MTAVDPSATRTPWLLAAIRIRRGTGGRDLRDVMGLGGYGGNSLSISVPIPTDERGQVGRRCPGCLGYFKLKPGTGLSTETCHCPYCGHAEDISEFMTPEQEEYVRSVGMREAQERILKPMMRRFGESLKGIEQATSRSPIEIRVEVRDKWRSIPLALYREREVETDVTCHECGLQFAVYGVFATCPDCTGMNTSAVFRKSMEAAPRRLSLLEGDLDSGMVEGLLSDALGSVVGAFDAVGKELRRRFPTLLPSAPRNLFQNVEALSTALGKAAGRSLAEALGEEQYARLVRMFQVRHVYEHNLGVVDADAIKKAPDLAAWRGPQVRPGTKRGQRLDPFFGKGLRRCRPSAGSCLPQT
jgi:hypothetical protein